MVFVQTTAECVSVAKMYSKELDQLYYSSYLSYLDALAFVVSACVICASRKD